MKFKVEIVEIVEVEGKSVIAYFQSDTAKQHFEIICNFNAFQKGIRKYETWLFHIKFKSEIFENNENGIKYYMTNLVCESAEPISETPRKH